MNDLPTITMEQKAALEKAEEYRTAIAEDKYPETPAGKEQREIDKASLVGFRALATGKKVINVRTAMSHAGLKVAGPQRGLPQLAIVRADAISCRYSFYEPEATFQGVWSNHGYAYKNSRIGFRDLAWNFSLAREPFNTIGRHIWTAMVPTIPPGIRPRYYRLSSHFILWEADWEKAPSDPFLLTHLVGDLYTVDAHWDLSELERGILEHASLQR